MTIMIRPSVATDATALAELAARTFRETFTADNRPEDMELHITHAYGTSQQERELVDPDITTLLVEVDGELAGWRGVAQSLMRKVESDAYRRGGRTLWLGVWERNERAKAFYHKNGFIDVGSHVFMVGTDAQTDRIMVRPLPTLISNGAA